MLWLDFDKDLETLVMISCLLLAVINDGYLKAPYIINISCGNNGGWAQIWVCLGWWRQSRQWRQVLVWRKYLRTPPPNSRSWWLGCGSHATEMNMRVSKVDDTFECPVWWVAFESIIPFFWFCVSRLILSRISRIETQGFRSSYEERHQRPVLGDKIRDKIGHHF